jgi:AcrR family transcriptional regulator
MDDAAPMPAASKIQPLEGEPLGKRERGKREKRSRILQAALEVFAEKGFAAATTQEIAARAGVAAGTLFLYANSKEELLLDAFAGDMAEVLETAEATLPAEAPVLDQLTHMARLVIDYHRGVGPELSLVLLRELMYGPVHVWPAGEKGPKGAVALIERIIEAGLHRRLLRAGLDTHAAAQMLFSTFHWQLSHWACGRVSSEMLEEQVRYRFDLCIRGIRR